MTSSLLLADHRAGWWRVLSETGDPLTDPAPAHLAEHAGVLRLPSTAPGGARALFADDLTGRLVGVGAPLAVPVAIPAEHLAADPEGRYVACSTGLGASFEPWSDLLTVADLGTGTAVRVRVRVGEPGVLVVRDVATGVPTVVLRHREPGEVEAIPVPAALAAGPHCPALRGSRLATSGDLGHGDAVDPVTGVVHLATEAGIERFVVDGGAPRRLETWPWPAPGRAYFLRFDPATRRVVAALRDGADPHAWHTWRNHVATWAPDGTPQVVAAGDGLVFRPDVHAGTVAWTVVHPDGDRLVVAGADGTTETALPAMSAGPRPGATPWDAVDGRPAQRRALALLGTTTAAVTRGGDGELHLVGPSGITRTVTVDSPLDEGGHLAALPEADATEVDGVGR
ncbi:hypothetical protein [Nocardioides sp. LML1-1-1.1]|uniref:hypothetical protein n=1 Tax=Nocardioides sp. LML1-1-1.1 TaxID=3135248 RepID=UPI00342CB0DD